MALLLALETSSSVCSVNSSGFSAFTAFHASSNEQRFFSLYSFTAACCLAGSTLLPVAVPVSAVFASLRLSSFPPPGVAALPIWISYMQRVLKLDYRPDDRQSLLLMEQFRPFRSLATLHCWQSLKDPQ